jgi:hypothetical protein
LYLKNFGGSQLPDSLVHHFIANANYDYYAIYPPEFLKEYQGWWAHRTQNLPLGLPWTSLLMIVCACSILHADTELATDLESRLGKSVRELADQYYSTARELHSAIPVGQSHIYTVQYLLHSCIWYKATAQFVECWISLASAIREAQNLGW